MIKRTPKMKTNTPRPGLTKASQLETEPAIVQMAKPEPVAAPRQQKPSPVKAAKPRAHLELIRPEAKTVCVAGSFNDWNPARTPLTRQNDGKWVGDLSVTGRHEYLFVVDGQWVPDPNAKESVQNPFGGRNSVLSVSA
jgi:hypothetical protein